MVMFMAASTMCASAATVMLFRARRPLFRLRMPTPPKLLLQYKNPASVRRHFKALLALEKQRGSRNFRSAQPVIQRRPTGRMNIVHAGSIDKDTTAGTIFTTKKHQQLFRGLTVKASHGFNMKISMAVPKVHLKIHNALLLISSSGTVRPTLPQTEHSARCLIITVFENECQFQLFFIFLPSPKHHKIINQFNKVIYVPPFPSEPSAKQKKKFLSKA